jgi:hypothetical protein
LLFELLLLLFEALLLSELPLLFEPLLRPEEVVLPEPALLPEEPDILLPDPLLLPEVPEFLPPLRCWLVAPRDPVDVLPLAFFRPRLAVLDGCFMSKRLFFLN